jgi:hypothetical protein
MREAQSQRTNRQADNTPIQQFVLKALRHILAHSRTRDHPESPFQLPVKAKISLKSG